MQPLVIRHEIQAHEDIVLLLHKHNADVNAQTEYGGSVLIVAYWPWDKSGEHTKSINGQIVGATRSGE